MQHSDESLKTNDVVIQHKRNCVTKKTKILPQVLFVEKFEHHITDQMNFVFLLNVRKRKEVDENILRHKIPKSNHYFQRNMHL
jgi:hypothetical protein